jgi:hypothetical protein
MTRLARWVTVAELAAMALGSVAPVAAAQGDGIGFDDMPGLQQAVTRTFSSPDDRERSAGADEPRDLRKPLVAMFLIAVYSFDTEANAAATYELLQTDMNATGFSGQPLELTPMTLPIGLEHTAAIATDTAFGEPYDFTLAMALDGTHVYTVISMTTGASPRVGFAETLLDMAATPAGADPAALDPAGGSTGGIWVKVPGLEELEGTFRGIEGVEDAALFPA